MTFFELEVSDLTTLQLHSIVLMPVVTQNILNFKIKPVRTDTIFYQLFQTLPGILFELIGQSATEAEAYQFASAEIKELAFRFDGLFLPLADLPEQPHLLCRSSVSTKNRFLLAIICRNIRLSKSISTDSRLVCSRSVCQTKFRSRCTNAV